MQKLDLHGLRHHEVKYVIENFVLLAELPVIIVTGNSFLMQEFVREVVEKYDLSWQYQNHINLGAIIITDKL